MTYSLYTSHTITHHCVWHACFQMTLLPSAAWCMSSSRMKYFPLLWKPTSQDLQFAFRYMRVEISWSQCMTSSPLERRMLESLWVRLFTSLFLLLHQQWVSTCVRLASNQQWLYTCTIINCDQNHNLNRHCYSTIAVQLTAWFPGSYIHCVLFSLVKKCF